MSHDPPIRLATFALVATALALVLLLGAYHAKRRTLGRVERDGPPRVGSLAGLLHGPDLSARHPDDVAARVEAAVRAEVVAWIASRGDEEREVELPPVVVHSLQQGGWAPWARRRAPGAGAMRMREIALDLVAPRWRATRDSARYLEELSLAVAQVVRGRSKE